MAHVLVRLRNKIRRHLGVSLLRTHIYRLTNVDPRPAFEANDTSLRIDLIEPTSADLLPALGPCNMAEVMERFARGDRCYGAWVGDELAHYAWVQDHGSHLLEAAGVEVPIPAGELWIYNCRTSDAHRGKGIYPLMLRRIADDYFAKGWRCVWGYATDHNVASQRGILKVGFVQTDTLRALRVGSRYIPLRPESAAQAGPGLVTTPLAAV